MMETVRGFLGGKVESEDYLQEIVNLEYKLKDLDKKEEQFN